MFESLAKRLQALQAQMVNSGRLLDTSYSPGDLGGQYYYEISAEVLDALVIDLQELVTPHDTQPDFEVPLKTRIDPFEEESSASQR